MSSCYFARIWRSTCSIIEKRFGAERIGAPSGMWHESDIEGNVIAGEIPGGNAIQSHGLRGEREYFAAWGIRARGVKKAGFLTNDTISFTTGRLLDIASGCSNQNRRLCLLLHEKIILLLRPRA